MKLGLKEIKNPKGVRCATIYFDTDLSATVDVWTGEFLDLQTLKKGLMLVLDNIKSYKSKKWLADISRMEGDFEAAKVFIATEVIPQAMSLGLECEALVLPNNIFSLLSVEETRQQMINHFELRMFATFDSATEWLESK